MEIFTKESAKPPPGFFATEAAGLRWLTEATPAGGPQVARVVAVTATRIDLERIHQVPPDVESAERFGRALASMHATGATAWGIAPPGVELDERRNPLGYIGNLRLPLFSGGENTRDRVTEASKAVQEVQEVQPGHAVPAAPPTWGQFYAQHRLRPYLRLVIDRGVVDRDEVSKLERLAARLEAGILDHAQPDGCPPVARMHGDLWAGNALWAGLSCATGAVLIDPAAHGGHAETDLAMMALFGFRYLARVLAAYGEVSPLAEGYAARVQLHQVHPLLVHAAMFGGDYGRAATNAAALYL